MSCQLTLKNITRTKMLAVIPILTLENLPPPSVGTLSLTIYTCDLCGKQSETNDRLLKHIETCHGDTFCSDSKLNSEHLPNDGAATINHNDVNHGLQYLYTCYKCDETFATHNLLASHVQTFHCEISWFTCNICLSSRQVKNTMCMLNCFTPTLTETLSIMKLCMAAIFVRKSLLQVATCRIT